MPTHDWYTEGFSFPESTAFALSSSFAFAEYQRVKASDPERVKLLNIRYTALQAYSIIEGYERIKAVMRVDCSDDNPEQGRTRVPAIYAAVSPLFRDPAQVKQMLANGHCFLHGRGRS